MGSQAIVKDFIPILGCMYVDVRRRAGFQQQLGYDTLHPQWPLQRVESLSPEPEISPFSDTVWVGRVPALTPDPQDAHMGQIDPPAAIQRVEASDNVIGLAGAGNLSCPIAEASPFPSRD